MKLRAESDSGFFNKTLKWFLDRLSQNMQQLFCPSLGRVPAWQIHRSADKSLARPGRKQTRKQIKGARDFNKIETLAVIKFLFLQDKTPKEIHAILTKTLACFLPGRAKDLLAPLY